MDPYESGTAERADADPGGSGRKLSRREQLRAFLLVLLLPLCCLLPVLLVSLGASLVASGLEPPAWLLGVGIVVAGVGVIVWHKRHDQGETVCR